MKSVIYLILWMILLRLCGSSIVYTCSGPIKGKEVVYDGTVYHSYQGIPYAEPPIGELRFLPPVPKQPWTEVLEATKEGPVCPQPEGNYKYEEMNEDCLYLNINVPDEASKVELLPILFYVHGGEFQVLSGNEDKIYGPQFYMTHEVIFVSVNYRLGALGFLSLATPEASGNAGIKDVILALQWIQANIYQFGGDPRKVTVGGNSAGAVLAHYLTLTHKTRNLFQQAFLMSGSALGYRFLAKHPVENALALGEELNLKTDNKTELIEKLKQISIYDIVDGQTNMGKNNKRNGVRPFAPFVPCVEENFSHAVITENPLDILKSGLPQNVPILAGFNAQEGIKMIPAVTKNPDLIKHINDNFELSIPSDIEYPYGSNESIELANSIKEFYFSNNNITDINFIEFITDTQFFYSIGYWINIHKENIISNVIYYYEFDFDGEFNWFKFQNNITLPGTSHADELGYMFLTDITKQRLPTTDAQSRQVIDNFLTLWTNFIKYGNPNPGCFVWNETGKELQHLKLNNNPWFSADTPRSKSYKFWSKVYNNYEIYIRNGGQIENKIIP